jgi:nitroreductase
MRIVAQKKALAAQNFMISMAVNYDTCPMEGFDSLSKKINLPAAAEINMIIGCGIREESLWKRFRIPFEEVYFKL